VLVPSSPDGLLRQSSPANGEPFTVSELADDGIPSLTCFLWTQGQQRSRCGFLSADSGLQAGVTQLCQQGVQSASCIRQAPPCTDDPFGSVNIVRMWKLFGRDSKKEFDLRSLNRVNLMLNYLLVNEFLLC
jgi:hypothetical protein